MPAEVQTVETSTCRVAYRDVGDGPVLLCLHGTGPGASGWGNYQSVSDDLATDFRVIIPDLPGFGGSRILQDDPSPWGNMSAQVMLEFLGKLGIDRAHVVGNSAGGCVAVHMATTRPDLIASLTLMACAGLRVPLFSPRELEGPRLLRSYQPNPSLDKMRAIVRAFVHDPSIIDVETVAKARYEHTLTPGGSAGLTRIARDRPKSLRLTQEQLANVKAPTLLIWGREDRFVGVDDALVYLAAIPDSRLVLIAQCGHWVQRERRGDFICQVRGFAGMVEAAKHAPSTS